MAKLTCQFVRPDRALYEGECASVILATPKGEFGIWPLHAPEIVALGDGVVRLNPLPDSGEEMIKVIVSGGYAQVDHDVVIVLADHARRSDDIDVAVVRETREKALADRDALPVDDHRRAYYEGKAHWCDLLLAHAEDA